VHVGDVVVVAVPVVVAVVGLCQLIPWGW
jgi:hypothetical protein